MNAQPWTRREKTLLLVLSALISLGCVGSILIGKISLGILILTSFLVMVIGLVLIGKGTRKSSIDAGAGKKEV